LLAFIVGAVSPLIDASDGLAVIRDSISYPFLSQAYEWLLAAVHMVSSDFLDSPL
jgi:hypothetical protein